MPKITYRAHDSVLLKTIERTSLEIPGQVLIVFLIFTGFIYFLVPDDPFLSPMLLFSIVFLIFCFFLLCFGYYSSVKNIINSLHDVGPIKYKKGTHIPHFIFGNRTTHYSFQNKLDKSRHQGYAWNTHSTNDQKQKLNNSLDLSDNSARTNNNISPEEFNQFVKNFNAKLLIKKEMKNDENNHNT